MNGLTWKGDAAEVESKVVEAAKKLLSEDVDPAPASPLTSLVDAGYTNDVYERREYASKIDIVDEAQGTGLLVWIKENVDLPRLFYAEETMLLALANALLAQFGDDATSQQ